MKKLEEAVRSIEVAGLFWGPYTLVNLYIYISKISVRVYL